MKINLMSKAVIALSIVTFSLTSCSDEEKEKNKIVEVVETGVTKFIVGVSAGENSDLLLTVDDIEKGTISIKGNGIQVIDPNIYPFSDEKAFLFEYRKGDPAAMQAVNLGENGLKISSEAELPGRKEFIAVFGDKMIATTGFVDKNKKRVQLFYLINPETGGLSEIITVDVNGIAEEGEYANFAGLVPLDNSRFVMAVEPFRVGQGTDREGKPINNAEIPSNFKDRVWLVVFKYDGDKTISVEKVIKDDRMSFAVGRRRSGRLNCIGEASDGNIYAFSPSNMISAKDGNFSTKPAAVLKLNKSTLEFDPTYFYDIETLSGGRKIQQANALTGDFFLLNMFDEVGKAWNMTQANRLALFNVKTGEFKWIEGLPEAKDINAYSVNPYVNEGNIYIPITGAGDSYIYKIDLETAKANKGLQILDLGDGSVISTAKLKRAN